MSIWEIGEAYERYVGRWSREIASQFVAWLDAPANGRWLDVGCGAGALTETILTIANPARVIGIDASEGFVAHARTHADDPRAGFQAADAMALPFADGAFDAAASALVLNFLPDPVRGVAEMVRVTRPGGLVAVYVWDYAGEMQLMRRFWDAAASLDPAAAKLDEGRLFPICRPEALESLFAAAGLTDVTVRAIDAPTVFDGFDDFWTPFLGGQGPAPSYAMSLTGAHRTELRERLRTTLRVNEDGSIHLMARAWVAKGNVPRS